MLLIGYTDRRTIHTLSLTTTVQGAEGACDGGGERWGAVRVCPLGCVLQDLLVTTLLDSSQVVLLPDCQSCQLHRKF